MVVRAERVKWKQNYPSEIKSIPILAAIMRIVLDLARLMTQYIDRKTAQIVASNKSIYYNDSEMEWFDKAELDSK